MITTAAEETEKKIMRDAISNPSAGHQYITGWRAALLKHKMRFRIFKLALKYYGFSSNCFHVIKKLKQKQELMHGKNALNKWVNSSGKYFFFLYAPGFYPGDNSHVITEEMNRIVPINVKPRLLRFAFFAITKKCPMRCEHCFEWDNINKREALDYENIRHIILKLKEAGVSQLHLSGGEPMLRVDEITAIAKEFSNVIEIFIVTSGFNVTRKNVQHLKNAGVTGFEVSLDHYSKTQHDQFRGYENAFECATNAIRYIREADMIACASVCCTRSFTTEENLYRYFEFARNLDCSFVQLLEPKALGHYSNKDVQLTAGQLKTLSLFYENVNQSKQFRNYPIVIYHGYNQPRIGCFLSGNRALYVDTNGDAMSCPFCHLPSGNLLKDDVYEVISKMRKKGCSNFGPALI